MLPSLLELAKQFKNNYIQSPEGQAFPNAYFRKPPQEQNKQLADIFTNAVTGATVAPSNAQLAKLFNKLPLSLEDRNVMGSFVELAEKGGRKPMGLTGFNAQRIAEGIGGSPEMGNKAMAELFNRAVMIMDLLKGRK